jgi:hypothetical protein
MLPDEKFPVTAAAVRSALAMSVPQLNASGHSLKMRERSSLAQIMERRGYL